MKLTRICLGVIGENETVYFAAEELRKYLNLIDEELCVEIFRAECAQKNCENVLWLGIDPLFSQALPAVSEPEYDDAIAICVKDGNGYITGTNPRSVLIAAYRFLRELGVCWVRPGKEGERIPKKNLSAFSVTVSEKASYRHRGLCIEGAPSFDNLFDIIDYLPKVCMNSYYFQSILPWPYMKNWYEHSYNPYLEKENYTDYELAGMISILEQEMKKRSLLNHRGGHGWTKAAFGDSIPDNIEELNDNIRALIAQINGERTLFRGAFSDTNLCYSNPKVRQGICDAVLRYYRNHPQMNLLHLWLADFPRNHCECEKCREKLPSDWYVMLLNEIDEKLQTEGIDVKIVFLLYYDLLWAPQHERLNHPKRFVLMFAPASRNYGDRYSNHLQFDGELQPYLRNQNEMPKNLSENIAHLKNWQKHFQGDSFAYEYHLMWAHSGDMGYESCAKNLHEDIKDLEAIGLNGLINPQSPKSFFPSGLPFWMMAKTLWQKDFDFETEADCYYRQTFGADGPKVREYLRTLSELCMLYNQQPFGDKEHPYGPYVKDETLFTDTIHKMQAVIDTHLSTDTSNDWKYLKLHTEAMQMLLTALKLREEKRDDEAKEAYRKYWDFFKKNEYTLRRVFDVFDTPSTLERKIFKHK